MRLALVIINCVFSVTGVLAQGAGYTLDWFVLAGGGQSSGGAYSLTGGFLSAETPVQTASQLYLPAVIR